MPLYEIACVSLLGFFLEGEAVTSIGIWLARPVHGHSFMLSLVINDNIIKVYYKKYF